MSKRDQRIVVRVAAPLRAALESEAAADGRELSNLVRRILIDHAAERIVASSDLRRQAA